MSLMLSNLLVAIPSFNSFGCQMIAFWLEADGALTESAYSKLEKQLKTLIKDFHCVS
jgi:hypothetical protein